MYNLIGITVSTNYSDLLPYIIEANYKYLKRWIFITDKDDKETIDILSKYSNIDILYFDFKSNGAVFNKGGAVALGQKYAYENYANDWYLLLDSDICLEECCNKLFKMLDDIPVETIYCCNNRKLYKSLSDYRDRKNYEFHSAEGYLLGFFQLYKKHLYYDNSHDASVCDLKFAMKFNKKYVIDDVISSHLGKTGEHWQGRLIKSDFLINSK